MNQKYLNKIIFYQMSNIDQRIKNPDQRLTDDITRWSESLSQLYSNVSKPVLDIIMFSKKLANVVGWEGPGLIVAWYVVSIFVMRIITPAFGRMTAKSQNNEGDYRKHHFDILSHSEEIAFYNGGAWENKRVTDSFNSLTDHANYVYKKKFWMGIADSILVKYGTFVLGYVIVGLPVFGPRSEQYLKSIGNDTSTIVKDYVRNTGLLINLAKAIGRIIISYKELQNLAGYTSLVTEVDSVLDDMANEKFVRPILNDDLVHNKGDVKTNPGTLKMNKVPILAPNGEIIMKELSFELQQGMNLFIDGPNGSGKTSIFRILGGLWPCFGGELETPGLNNIFFIPQTAYLPAGNLRDQIIYPDSKMDMLRKGVVDKNIEELLAKVELTILVEKWGLDNPKPWHDIFSGGQRQRVAIARCYYHKPKFAVMDECTSGVSVDVEPKIYSQAKDLGITLITCSHRPSLKKYHDYLLKLDGEGNYVFGKMLKEDLFVE